MTQRIDARIALVAMAICLTSRVGALAALPSLPKTSAETCALLSPRVASTALNGPAAPAPVQMSKQICLWEVPSLRVKSPHLSYGVSSGAGVAGREGVTRKVDGVGDAAFWDERDGSLLAARHGVVLDVHLRTWNGEPIKNLAGITAVARDILSHF